MRLGDVLDIDFPGKMETRSKAKLYIADPDRTFLFFAVLRATAITDETIAEWMLASPFHHTIFLWVQS